MTSSEVSTPPAPSTQILQSSQPSTHFASPGAPSLPFLPESPLSKDISENIHDNNGHAPQDDEIPLAHLSKPKYLVALSGAAIIEAAAWFPCDLIACRIMVDRSKTTIPFAEMTKNIWRKEGIRGFYRGFSTQFLSQCVIDSIYFCGLEAIKEQWDEKFVNAHGDMSNMERMARGAVAGFLGQLMINFLNVPTDVIVSKLQIQGMYKQDVYRGFTHAVQHIYENHGVRGFFRGFGGSMTYLTSESAVFWACYDPIRHHMLTLANRMSETEGAPAWFHPSMAHFLSGGIAGVMTAIITNPLVVGTIRIQCQDLTAMMDPTQKKHSNFLTCMKHTFKHEGLSGLMKGTPSRCAWMFIEKAMLTSIYEQVKLFALKDEYKELYGQGSKNVELV